MRDRDYRVVMLCEEIPAEKSSYSGRGSRRPGAWSAQGSELDLQTVQLSRERPSHGRPCYVEREREGSAHSVYGSSLN